MTDQEAWGIVAILVAETTGWNDDSTNVYHAEIRQWPDMDAAATAVRSVCHTWTQQSRPPFAVIEQAYRAELRERSARQGIPRGRRAVCDGSGWVEDAERSSRPCRQCSPYLSEIFDDPDRWNRWRSGTQLKHLVVLEDEMRMPVPCVVADRDDPLDPIIHPRTGRPTTTTRQR
jgi:hypothetical protein